MAQDRECTCGNEQRFGRFCKKCGGVINSDKPKSASCTSRHGQVEPGEHYIDCGEVQ